MKTVENTPKATRPRCFIPVEWERLKKETAPAGNRSLTTTITL